MYQKLKDDKIKIDNNNVGKNKLSPYLLVERYSPNGKRFRLNQFSLIMILSEFVLKCLMHFLIIVFRNLPPFDVGGSGYSEYFLLISISRTKKRPASLYLRLNSKFSRRLRYKDRMFPILVEGKDF